MKPMFGTKLVTKASTPHTAAAGMPSSHRAPVSMTATIAPKIVATMK